MTDPLRPCEWCGDTTAERVSWLMDPRRPAICWACYNTAAQKYADVRALLHAVAPGFLDDVEPDTVGYWIGEGRSVHAIARILLGLPDADGGEA